MLAVRFTVVNTGSTTIWGGHDDPTWSPTVIGSNGRGYGVRFGGILHPGEPAAAFNPSAGDGVIAIGDGTCTSWTETWYQTPRTSVSHCFLVTIPSGIKPTLIKMSFAATAGVTSTGEWSIP